MQADIQIVLFSASDKFTDREPAAFWGSEELQETSNF